MADFWQRNDDNQRFWDWFFQVEDMSELQLEDNETLVITQKNAETGEKRTFSGVTLKKTLQKKTS